MGAIGDAGGDAGFSKVPIIGGFMNDPSDRNKVHDLYAMSQAYNARRPMQADAYMNAMHSRAGAYNSASEALNQLYGPGAGNNPALTAGNPGDRVGTGASQSLYRDSMSDTTSGPTPSGPNQNTDLRIPTRSGGPMMPST